MNNIDKLIIKTLRVLSVEEIAKASSGHPGIALGAAPIMHTLYSRILKVNANEDKWFNRDRFILGAGHASSLLYAMLHIAGFDVTNDELKTFRQLHSRTAGHPEMQLLKGIDASSGPLGQGIPEGVGMAIAEEHLASKFNKEDLKLVDHYTYVLCGDGDLQEGLTQEAISLAGNLALKKLIVIYDSNDIQLDGPVKMANTENVKSKFEAMNWNYLRVENGEDIEDITAKLKEAKTSNKPTIVEVKTIIGATSSMAGTSKVHGKPLTKEEVSQMRASLGGSEFSVNDDVYSFYEGVKLKGQEMYNNWLDVCAKYEEKYKDDYSLFKKMVNDEINVDFNNIFEIPNDYVKATRVSGGEILNELSSENPMIIGGSADLTASTMAKGADGDFTKENRLGRNINFGVREHAMASITNGICLHGGLRPFCSGFFVFSDYMKPAIRLSALMDLPVVYIFTHDTIAVGEDGPSHEPIEQLTMLRSIPNLNVIRPADAYETKEAYEIAFKSKNRPTAIILTRQNVNLIKTKYQKSVSYGAYIASPERERIDKIIIATGSEVYLAIEVQKILLDKGIDTRVVSMPSINLFNEQKDAYKEKILPSKIRDRVAIEMGEGSHLYQFIGLDGKLINITSFGLSGKFPEVMSEFGFTPEKIASKIIK